MKKKTKGHLPWLVIFAAIFFSLISIPAYLMFMSHIRDAKEYELKLALMNEIVETFPLIEKKLILLNESKIHDTSFSRNGWREDPRETLSDEETQVFESLFSSNEPAVLNVSVIEFEDEPHSIYPSQEECIVALSYRGMVVHLGDVYRGHYELTIRFDELSQQSSSDRNQVENIRYLSSGFYVILEEPKFWFINQAPQLEFIRFDLLDDLVLYDEYWKELKKDPEHNW